MARPLQHHLQHPPLGTLPSLLRAAASVTRLLGSRRKVAFLFHVVASPWVAPRLTTLAPQKVANSMGTGLLLLERGVPPHQEILGTGLSRPQHQSLRCRYLPTGMTYSLRCCLHPTLRPTPFLHPRLRRAPLINRMRHNRTLQSAQTAIQRILHEALTLGSVRPPKQIPGLRIPSPPL